MRNLQTLIATLGVVLSCSPVLAQNNIDSVPAVKAKVEVKGYKLIPAVKEDGSVVQIMKPKNKIEKTYDGIRHQMVIHPKITRGAKWTAAGVLYAAQLSANLIRH